tara:strand:+ start:19961 stop:20989 length:1029 start_codon:yes stop_codon:yes gene_type:complete
MSGKIMRSLKGLLEVEARHKFSEADPRNFRGSPDKISKNFSIRALQTLTVCLLLIPLINSCEDTFEPFQLNDKFYFTMYGYLDASADTQWVRISPVRGTFDAPPEIPDMQVTIEDMSDGSSIVMNNKLVQFGNQFNAINVWTDENIQAGNTYQLLASNPNGTKSQVVVTIPEPFPVPKLLTVTVPGIPPEFFLLIDDVEQLADVQSRWHYRVSTPFWEEERFHVFSLKESVSEDERVEGSYRLELDPDKEKEEIMESSLVLSIPGGQIEFLENQYFIASAGPEWDENVTNLEDLIYTLPDGFSNVEDGLGYVVGIFSRNIPFRTCLNDARELIACPEAAPFF